MAPTRPLLIAVLSVASTPSTPGIQKLQDGRLRIDAYARTEGYDLFDICEMIDADESGYDRLATMAARSEAAAILICGTRIDRRRINAIAANAGMRVTELPAERQVFAQPGRHPPKRRGPS